MSYGEKNLRRVWNICPGNFQEYVNIQMCACVSFLISKKLKACVVSHKQKDSECSRVLCLRKWGTSITNNNNPHIWPFGWDGIEDDFCSSHYFMWNIEGEGLGMNHKTTKEDLAKRYTTWSLEVDDNGIDQLQRRQAGMATPL